LIATLRRDNLPWLGDFLSKQKEQQAMRAWKIRQFVMAIVGVALCLWIGPVWAQFDASGLGGGQFGSDPLGGFGRTGEPVVAVTAQFTAPTAGQPGRLFVTAQIKPNWHIYSITQPPGGPVATTIRLGPSQQYRVIGDFQTSPPPERKQEPVFDNLVVESHENSVTWHAPLEFAPGVDPATVRIEGNVTAQPCDANSCRPPERFPFTAVLGPGVSLPTQSSAGPPAAAGQPAGEEGVAPQPPAESVSSARLAAILAGAFLGGLILNLMPCVLPVISLKLLAFVEQSGESRAHTFALNLWFAAGLMLVFLVLASLSASLNLAWGEQFTFTWFKVTMTALVFVLALSFLGVWEIPIPGFVGSGAAGQLQTREGAAGAFFKGVFTTILATPCTGPFLGYVFGFTLNQPPHVTYLIFGTVGLGMASPYIVIGLFPELIRFLPKPGAWMDTVKQVMGFLLLGTVVYLFTTMNQRYFIPTLTLLVGLWFTCWLIGRTPLTAAPQRRLTAWISGTASAALVGLLAFTILLQEHDLAWKEFSPQALGQARAEGKTVMVDFTADWCPNCKYNLAWAIDKPRVKDLVEENDVVPMLADWTDRSETIKKALAELQRQSIPVLAIWPANASDGGVIILDGLLTEGQVLEALRRAGPSADAPAARTAMSSG
jgi:thiol:disulfide interchange protein